MILKVYSFHSWKIMRHLLSLFLVPDATPTLISHFSSVRGLFCWFQDFFPCLYFSKIWSLCSLACTYLDLSCLVFTKLLFFCMFVYFTKFRISEILTHFFFALCFQPHWLYYYYFFYSSRTPEIPMLESSLNSSRLLRLVFLFSACFLLFFFSRLDSF